MIIETQINAPTTRLNSPTVAQLNNWLEVDWYEKKLGLVRDEEDWALRMASNLVSLGIDRDTLENMSESLDESSFNRVVKQFEKRTKPSKNRFQVLKDRSKTLFNRFRSEATKWLTKEPELSVKVNSIVPNFNPGQRLNNLLSPMGQKLAYTAIIGAVMVAPFGLAYFTNDPRPKEQSNDFYNTAGLAVDTPEESHQIVDYNNDDIPSQPDSLLTQIPDSYKSLKGEIREGESILSTVHRLWKQQYGVEPTNAQLYAAAKWLCHNQGIYDEVFNNIPRGHAKVHSRAIQPGTQINLPVNNLLVASI